MRKPGLFTMVVLMASIAPVVSAAPVTLVQTSDPGFYNNHIGTLLNLSATGSDTCSEPFPTANDCSGTYATAPNLSAASAVLGNWLTDPAHLNADFASLSSIPTSWALGTEVAVVYAFTTAGATGVTAQFGVDNGIFAWLDGSYLLGRRDEGGVSLGEYSVTLGNLAAGTHYLQLLLEDHGVANGYAVNISGDSMVPIPEPQIYATMLAGLGALGLMALRRKQRDA